MENENRDELHTQTQEQPAEQIPEEAPHTPYVPRPLWQRILAWVGLILFATVIVLYYIRMMRGGI